MVIKNMNVSQFRLIQERKKLVNENMKLRAKNVDLYKPINRNSTKMFHNITDINRIDLEIKAIVDTQAKLNEAVESM
jgi:hypothetical protein